ncbi:phosphoribosyl-ATP diphosphatase [Pelagibacteraceae bacterium]|nr:phosphoribosyl-ATP diphosphatase [Pelagibacteraceae bacterium]
MLENLEYLIKTIRKKRNLSSVKSYTNKLLNDKNLSLAKVREEIDELIEAVEKNSNKTHEATDVIYHLMVYLETNNIKIEDIMIELKKRQK